MLSTSTIAMFVARKRRTRFIESHSIRRSGAGRTAPGWRATVCPLGRSSSGSGSRLGQPGTPRAQPSAKLR